MTSLRGFTMIEVLVAALVLGIGLVGIIGMQTTAAVANRRAADMRTGAELAETVLERLKRDGEEWTTVAQTLGTETWLGAGFQADALGQWVLPPSVVAGGSSPLYNDLAIPSAAGGMVPDDATYYAEKNSRYCVQYRLTWVIQGEIARADVRVFWPSRQAGERFVASSCDVFGDSTALNPADYNQFFEWVRVTGMVRRNSTAAVVGPT